MLVRGARSRTSSPAARVPDAGHGRPGGRGAWTLEAIVRALERLHRADVELSYDGLIAAGHLPLARAIQNFGGLQRLRRQWQLPRPRVAAPQPGLQRDEVLAEIARRHAAGEPLAWSKVPARLRAGGERHFGNWPGAIAAAGLDYARIRLRPRASKPKIS
jgi:hypothetical protein